MYCNYFYVDRNVYIYVRIKVSMKEKTSISIDEDLKKKAEMAQINISAIAEIAIRDKLSIRNVIIKSKCEFCGKEERKATFRNPIGLTWLCPDERWICDKCLRNKIKSIDLTGR